MKVILLENLAKIGSIGEVIDVKRGFARNYLISNKKALYASKENIKEVDKIKTELNKKDQEKKKNAKQIYETLKDKTYEVKKLTTENKDLYGSIKPKEISNYIKENVNADVNPSQIILKEELNKVGLFKANISFHAEVQANISIKIDKIQSK